MMKMKTTFVFLALIALAQALPAYGKTYKTTYSDPCTQLWSAVKDVLAGPDNYEVVSNDDAQMTASYKVKHEVHANVSGAILQRTNHVTLVPHDAECEMRVVSNYSGWEHDDKGDFKTRVDESLARMKGQSPAQPAKPAPAAK